MFDLEDDSALRRLCYFTAFLLILVPLFQAAGASWPLGLGQVRWRMVATNTFSQSLQLPFLGLVMILAIARSVKDTTMARVIGVVSALTAVIMVVSIGLFILDSIQLKSIVSSREMQAYNLATVRVGFVLLVFTISFAVLAYVAFKTPAAQMKIVVKGSKRVVDDEPVGFLIGQDLSK
jgi:hypothetical protein